MLRHIGRHSGFYLAMCVVLAVLATAVCTIVARDLLPTAIPNNYRPEVSADALRSGRAVVAIGLLLLLALAIITLKRALRETGAHYYVQIDDGHHGDGRGDAAALARRQGMSFRSFSRVTDSVSPVGVDLAEHLDSVCAAIQEVANDDDDKSWIEVAVRAPWPALLAIGFEWPLSRATVLREPDGHRLEQPVGVRARELITLVKQNERPTVQYVVVDIHLMDAVPPTASALVNATTALVDDPDLHFVSGFDRSGGHLFGEPQSAADRQRVVIGQRFTGAPRALLQKIGSRSQSGTVTVSAHDAAALLARAVLTAADRYPSAQIVVSARVPDSVAIVAGRILANSMHSDDALQDQNWASLWHRLTLLDESDHGQLGAVRVRQSQPRVSARN